MKRLNLTFENDDEIQEYRDMAKDLGHTSINNFAKTAMKFMHLYKKRNDEMLTKMDLILSKVDEVKTDTTTSVERVEKEIKTAFERYLETPTDSEYLDVYKLLVRVLGKEHVWLTYDEIKTKMGIDGDKRAEDILQDIILKNREFKLMVEKRGNKFRAREEALPHKPYRIEIRD